MRRIDGACFDRDAARSLSFAEMSGCELRCRSVNMWTSIALLRERGGGEPMASWRFNVQLGSAVNTSIDVATPEIKQRNRIVCALSSSCPMLSCYETRCGSVRGQRIGSSDPAEECRDGRGGLLPSVTPCHAVSKRSPHARSIAAAGCQDLLACGLVGASPVSLWLQNTRKFQRSISLSPEFRRPLGPTLSRACVWGKASSKGKFFPQKS